MSATKIGENTTNISKLQFFTINLHFVTSNQLSKYGKLNFPLISSVYFAFFPLEMQRRLKQIKVYHTFSHFVWKKNDPQTFKSGSSKNPFLQCVCYYYNLLRWMFFILCDTWKKLLFMKVYRCCEIVLSAMLLLSLKSAYFKKSVFYDLSPQ